MAKNTTFELPEAEATELEQLLAQMQRSNQQRPRDQKELDALKAETRLIAEQTREMLSQLEAATA